METSIKILEALEDKIWKPQTRIIRVKGLEEWMPLVKKDLRDPEQEYVDGYELQYITYDKTWRRRLWSGTGLE